jgi:hypothetical protein
MGYLNIKNKTIPETSYLLDYRIYAFKPAVSADVCGTDNNTAVICRFNQTLFQINASISSQSATLNLKILIPFSYAEIKDSASLEADDIATTTVTENETIIELELHTSQTDSDKLNITSNGIPRLVFIQKADYKTAGNADLHIFVGNTSAVESFGSAGTGADNYCRAERAVNIAGKGGEVFPARFGILAW